jgi:hypothetical protein
VSYLLQYVRRSASTRTPVARVDENTRLNRPGLYGDAYVRVFVSDTTVHRGRLEPEFVLEIADCTNAINLEFSVASPQLRENSLFKIDTLIGALQRFRDGLADEVAQAEGAA